MGIYPSEFGLKCMEVEAVHGPSALIDNNEENSEDESESDDENLRNEKLRTYELNKLRCVYGPEITILFCSFNCCCFRMANYINFIMYVHITYCSFHLDMWTSKTSVAYFTPPPSCCDPVCAYGFLVCSHSGSPKLATRGLMTN